MFRIDKESLYWRFKTMFLVYFKPLTVSLTFCHYEYKYPF